MCGHEFPVKPKRQLTQREGELREMRRQDALERIEKKEKKKIGRARTLPELLALKKGYSPAGHCKSSTEALLILLITGHILWCGRLPMQQNASLAAMKLSLS